MKYELLKRTAIALFVGGVISTYASADAKLDDALATIKTAIETNKAGLESKADKALVDELDEDVGNLEDKVSGIVATAANKEDLGKLNDAVETLRDDVNNNTDTLSQNSEDIAANKEAIEANKTAIATNKAGLESKADKALVDELDEDVGNLEDKVSGIVATAANKEDLGKLNDAVETLRDDVNNNTDILSQNSTDIAANKEAIEANKAALETKADKTALETKADQDYVEGLEKDVKINTSDIKELSEGIRDNILPALETNRTDIDANKAAIGDLATVIDEAVKNVEAGIETNAANIASNADKIATNESKVAENRKDINKNASRIEDTRNKQVLQNARLDNHNSRIDANKAALETKADKTALEAKADKTALEAKADKADVDANKEEIAKKADKTELANKADKNNVYSKSQTDEKFALKADNSVVRDQATDISNLRTDVNAHKVDIDKLRTDVNVHTKRLDHLDNRVNKLDKDLKRGLAAQAALTGLFQPYTVGKANFTAAVGGYKSQTAVAIGTGYRYNQNIATKAGVAFTQGGGVTYNAGVNFEW